MEELPFITLIMPIRNESAFISRSLGAVLAQDYPADRFEVLVADGMSTDGTREIVRELQSKHPPLRLVDNPGGFVPTGMNAAIKQAVGEIIIRVDGHTIVERDYVRQCVAALQRSGADNVGGRMDAVSEERFGQAVALATSSPFGVGGARFHYSDYEEWVDTVYMGAWPREVFGRIGLFDEEQVRNQDDELNYRLLERGGRILLNPLIKSKYYNRSTLCSLWRQYYQYGFWKVRVMQKHPRQMRWRQFVPPSLVLATLLTALLSTITMAGRLLLLIVLGLYLTANLGASMLSAHRVGWRHLAFLPITFATLHWAYGVGFLFGLIRFLSRWKISNNFGAR